MASSRGTSLPRRKRQCRKWVQFQLIFQHALYADPKAKARKLGFRYVCADSRN
ncbi:hypothetical protein CDAR_443381, partial [Caerostris darwini]